MQEIDAKPDDRLVLRIDLQERDVHREVVLVRRAVGDRVGRLEGALVEVRRDADRRGIFHGVDDAAPARLRIKQRLPQVEKRSGRVIPRHRSVLGDGDALVHRPLQIDVVRADAGGDGELQVLGLGEPLLGEILRLDLELSIHEGVLRRDQLTNQLRHVGQPSAPLHPLRRDSSYGG